MQDIHPIKPVIETPILSPAQTAACWMVAGFVVAVFVTWLAVWIQRKRHALRKRRPLIEKPPDPYETAMVALEKARQHLDQASWKPFYFAATDVVKTFLSDKHRINVRGRTTRELLRDQNLPKQTRERLRTMVTEMDEAKFANRTLDGGPAYAMLDAVQTFLRDER